jgi:hypothetical protein
LRALRFFIRFAFLSIKKLIMATSDNYHEITFYTLSHPGKEFIHQHVVDAYALQSADSYTKPITIWFALAGLYLAVEKNFSGKQVQHAHMLMAKKPKQFPQISLPSARGAITVTDLLAMKPGMERDNGIYEWCKSVWASFADQHEKIREWTEGMVQVH